MGYNINSTLDLQQLFIDFIKHNFSISLILLIIYVSSCIIFIAHIPLRIIVQIVVGVWLLYTIYLLIYDITYIQFLYALKIDEHMRVITSGLQLPARFSRHAPSKSMPAVKNYQFRVLRNVFQASFVVKAYYKILALYKKRLSFIARIYVIILSLPRPKYKIHSRIKNSCLLQLDVLKNHKYRIKSEYMVAKSKLNMI